MFGSQKVYGGHHNQSSSSSSNNNYGNPTPSYSSAHQQSSSDSFWGSNRGIGNNYQQRQLDPAIANDSLYGYQNSHSLDKNNLARHANLAANKNEKYGNLGSIVPQKKTTTWASIASQPAKSQPKCLKAKMAAGLTGTTSKFLPPTVTMDAMSWDSKNGSVSSGGKAPMMPSPPPAVMSPPPAPVPVQPPPVDDLYTPDPHPRMGAQQHSHAPPPPVNRENSWGSNNGNSSPPMGPIPDSDTVRHAQNLMPNKAPPPPMMPNNGAPVHEHNGNHSHVLANSNNLKYSSQRNDYHPSKPPMIDNPPLQQYSRPPPPPQNSMREPPHHHPVGRDHLEDDGDSLPPTADNAETDLSHLLLEKLRVENNYNPKDFDLDLEHARFFIIKSYSEDDIHRSIKYSIWCSTEHGNKRLDNAFRQQEDKGPIYLFFSVNRSGHFCGVAQMTSHVDYNASSGVWSQDKWKGQFKVSWIYVKDVPNDELRHITLENNENKPVTNSRDTQEVPYEKGKMVMAIIHRYKHQTSIFDDFLHYEKKQEEELHRKPSEIMPGSPPPSSMHSYYKMQSANSQYHHANSGREPQPPQNPMMPFRGGAGGMIPGGGGGTNNSNNYNKPRSYQDQQRDHQGRMNADYPPPSMSRNDYGRNPNTNNFRNNYGPPSQASRDHHRNDYHGGGGAPRDYGRDPYYPAPPAHQQYNQRDQGGYYQGGPPQQRDYPPSNDYNRGGDGRMEYPPPPRDYGRNHHHHPDRVQSWRN